MANEDGRSETDELKAALVESRSQLQILRSSFRFQLGDAIVTSLSRGPSRRLRALVGAMRRGYSLLLAAQVRNCMFSGLPQQDLPIFPDLPPISDLRALRRYLDQLAKNPSETPPPATPNSPWATSVVTLSQEFSEAIHNGYPLPQRVMPNAHVTQPRRVLYVSRHEMGTIRNGYARRTREIALQLVKLGITPTIGVTSESNDACSSFEGIEQVALAPKSSTGLKNYIGQLANAIARVARQTDAEVIHAGSNFLIGLASIVAARRLGLPCVYELRGLWELSRLEIDSAFAGTIGFQFQSAMERYCADEADATVVSSEGIAEELIRRGACRRTFWVAQSGANAPERISSDAIEEWRSRLPPGSKVLGFAGSITRYEGFATFAAAMAKLVANDSSYRLIVLGDGDFREAAEALFLEAGVADHVLFAGRLSAESVAAMLQTIDLAVYPRDATRMTCVVESLKPVEALAAGVPVVISDLPPLMYLRRECPGVTEFAAGNAAGLAEKIAGLFDLPVTSRSESGARAREWISRNRSWMGTAEIIRIAYADASLAYNAAFYLSDG